MNLCSWGMVYAESILPQVIVRYGETRLNLKLSGFRFWFDYLV
jgi:hypothetical protein